MKKTKSATKSSKSSLGKHLESIRIQKKFSQAQLAKKFKISQVHLSQIERGAKTVSPKRAKFFAHVLNLSEIKFIELALQDIVRKIGINAKVELKTFNH